MNAPPKISGSITSISAQKKSQNRVNIFLDESFAFGLHMDIVVSESLCNGTLLSEEQVESLLTEDSFLKAREAAFRFISYRPRSEQEVKSRLTKNEHTTETVKRVIDRLLELNMLDDVTFAREYVGGRLRNKGYGPHRIRKDLKRKGITDEIIDAELLSAFGETTSQDLAAKSAKKIFRRLSAIDDIRVRKKKLSEYLSRRGFGYDDMDLAIDQLEHFVSEIKT